jgi:hypothetical protein
MGTERRIAGACLEDVEVSTSRGLEKAMVRQLAQSSWVHDHFKHQERMRRSGMSETLEQLDELIVTLGASVGRS